jgi:hypothetical protein
VTARGIERPFIDRIDAELRARLHWIVRWNLAPFYDGMRSARLYVVSIPKSGRTWLRVFLTAYDAFREGREPNRDLSATELALGVLFAHDRWDHSVAPWPALALGRCLVPRRRARRAKTVLLVRDPRDAAVSLFFQLSRRSSLFSGTMEEMLKHPVFGVRALVDIMNAWAGEWRGSSRLLLLRYEDLLASPDTSFRRFVDFGFGPVDEESLRRAAEFSSFPRMQELEAQGYFSDSSMRSFNADDADSFKARRGKIGGYRDYLTAGALAFADREVSRLDPWFGYSS